MFSHKDLMSRVVITWQCQFKIQSPNLKALITKIGNSHYWIPAMFVYTWGHLFIHEWLTGSDLLKILFRKYNLDLKYNLKYNTINNEMRSS